MKKIWLNLPIWNKKAVTTALESGIDAIMTTKELVSKVRQLGRITVIAPSSGDLKIPTDVDIRVIKNKKDEQEAARVLRKKIVVVRTTDWSIIPLENLIAAAGETLYTFARTYKDVKLAAEILETGVAGIVLETTDPAIIKKSVSFITSLSAMKFNLKTLRITKVTTIGIGDRVCVDTCSNLTGSQGMLVGNSSKGMFLVHAENIDNPYVAARPFRINAGAVHAYFHAPGGTTRYLGELKSGDPVLITDHTGKSITAYVGRSKVEKRPLLVVDAVEVRSKMPCSIVLQNAETIRLTTPKGEPISVVQLRCGSKVLGYVEKQARHFGIAIDETIVEQ